MKYININGKKYEFIIGISGNNEFRKSFNELTQKTFGFNFEQWYQDGYWADQYIPYSLMEGGKVVSNVSVSVMDFEVFGEMKRYIQLGTVMTDTNYKNQGLLRVIMEEVIKEWRDKSELIFLFANSSVLDFYPKFGFEKLKQYQCSKTISMRNNNGVVKKLNMFDEHDRTLVYNKTNIDKPITSLARISMCGNPELIMFYCTLFMSDNVYHVQDYDAVVFADFVGDTIEILDIFCTEEISLDNILSLLVNENIKRAKLYFTPKRMKSYEITQLDGEDTLFVLGEDRMLLSNNQFMFPKLSHT